MIEALVAVIVASVGFIGAARMQTLGMKTNASTQLRQKAVLLTYQMTDRMRANQAGFSAGYYNNVLPGDPSCLTTPTGCTPAQLAMADMTEWLADIEAQLPSVPKAKGVVCIDNTPNDGTAAAPACDGVGNLVVKVFWTDGIGGDTVFATAVRP